jgi:hypothetical protein
MDSSIIAVAGTLGGVIVSAIGTYFIQKTISERQRRWSLEDQDRNRQDELGREQRRIKRELLSKRLEVVEETIKLKMKIISRSVGEDLGIPMVDDEDAEITIKRRVQDITDEAWASVAATGSADLKQYWRQINKAYWAVTDTGSVEPEQWQQAQTAYIEAFKLMDEMKSKV